MNPKKIELNVKPEIAAKKELLLPIVARTARLPLDKIVAFKIRKRSIDARKRNIKIRLLIDVFIQTPQEEKFELQAKNVGNRPEIIIVGAGPAGLFAAIKLIELNLKPLIFERGKDIRARRRDLAKINKEGIVNPESNYCFGEGGAGTYSDGKLYTRSNKRGDVNRILDILIAHGANPEIKVDAHPHIGTNKLPGIIAEMRNFILSKGGEIHFNSKVTKLLIQENKIQGVEINKNLKIKAQSVILATGHSARSVFEMLHQQNILLEAKPFALGVRVEHPQVLINQIQYHGLQESDFLPPASYQLKAQIQERGIYSFCMCPGGIIAPCATNENEIVVNGWSPSKRNNPFANSGLVVEIRLEDLKDYRQYGALASLYFQKDIEQKAFQMGGGNLVAPAQRMMDFLNHRISKDLPSCSYYPGLKSVKMQEVLPKFISQKLKKGLKQIGKRMPKYLTNEAILVGVESRTSSPIRIPRDRKTLQHPQIEGFFPCGEGAGYAGGIVSAAIDGELCAAASFVFMQENLKGQFA